MRKNVLVMIGTVLLLAMMVMSGCSDEKKPSKAESEETKVVFNNRIAKDAAPVGSNIVVINDVKYELPVRVSELMENGWTDTENKFGLNVNRGALGLIDYFLYSDDGERITINRVVNDGSEKAALKDCLVLKLAVEKYDYNNIKFPKSFIFPGGITEKCTESDVISVYGDTADTKIFSDESETYEIMSLVGSNAPFKDADKEACYKKHIDTGTSYTFYYDEDKSNIICGAEISVAWDN